MKLSAAGGQEKPERDSEGRECGR